jgi:hypothetical protein
VVIPREVTDSLGSDRRVTQLLKFVGQQGVLVLDGLMLSPLPSMAPKTLR